MDNLVVRETVILHYTRTQGWGSEHSRQDPCSNDASILV